MSFKSYLKDLEDDNGIVINFGRMNPITKGHEELMKYMVKLAKQKKAEAKLYLSHSVNSKKNPLTFQDKLWAVEIAAPRGLEISNDTSLKNIFQVAEQLVKSGWTSLYFIVGADRIGDFDSLHKYVKEWSDGNARIEIISFSGKSRIGNYSGTRMRQLVKDNDMESFIKDLPDNFNQKNGEILFNKVKEGMGH